MFMFSNNKQGLLQPQDQSPPRASAHQRKKARVQQWIPNSTPTLFLPNKAEQTNCQFSSLFAHALRVLSHIARSYLKVWPVESIACVFVCLLVLRQHRRPVRTHEAGLLMRVETVCAASSLASLIMHDYSVRAQLQITLVGEAVHSTDSRANKPRTTA